MPDTVRKYVPILTIFIYLIFAVWLTWPAVDNLGSAIPGNEGCVCAFMDF